MIREIDIRRIQKPDKQLFIEIEISRLQPLERVCANRVILDASRVAVSKVLFDSQATKIGWTINGSVVMANWD